MKWRNQKPAVLAGIESQLMPRTILHPTDYSASSRQAFALACRLARAWDSRLTVLHVVEPVYVSPLSMAPPPPLPEGYRDASEGRLRRMQPHDPLVRVEHRLDEGDVTDVILRVAGELGCELIVMSSRERTWLQRLFSRSVAAKVRRKAPCPVMIVEPSASGFGKGPVRINHAFAIKKGDRHASGDTSARRDDHCRTTKLYRGAAPPGGGPFRQAHRAGSRAPAGH